MDWDRMAGEWDDLACQYAPAVWQQWLQPQIVTHLQQQQHTAAALVLLDFGCGTGMLIEQIFERQDALLEHCSSITILAVDASAAMLAVLQDKIRSCGWNNDATGVMQIIPHHWNPGSAGTEQFMTQYTQSVHILLAALVLSYIPPVEAPATMQALQRLLVVPPLATPVLLQIDWPAPTALSPPVQDQHHATMTMERAHALYAAGGFVPTTSTLDIHPLRMAPGNAPDLLFGVARV